MITADTADDELHAPERISKSEMSSSTICGIPQLVKSVTASGNIKKRKPESVEEAGTAKQRKHELVDLDEYHALKYYLNGAVTAGADPDAEEDGREIAAPASTIIRACPEAATLPRLRCTLDGKVEVSHDSAFFRLPLKARTDSGKMIGFCLMPITIFSEEQEKAIRSRRFPGVHRDHRECSAQMLHIEEEVKNEYIVAIKLSHAGQDFDGSLRLPNVDIYGELLEPWLAERGETILESVEEGPDREVEAANTHNRTVHIISSRTVGEQRSTAINVEIWSGDGKISVEVPAKIMESTKCGIGYRLRLRVKLAEESYIYLSGWVHADHKGGRFADEYPGQLFTE